MPPASDDGVPPALGPPCVIDWSGQLARAEADLRLAVLVTVISSNPVDLATAMAAVNEAFNLDGNTSVLRRSHMENVFILFVADEATVSSLIHAGPTTGPGEIRLLCRRWSRQAFAEGDSLPALVDVTFRGVPAHAWEMGTAEALLSPYGWPQTLHPETRDREDYSMFRVTAWCFNPRSVPRSRVLHVVEPSVGEILAPPGKLTLRYPVSISVDEAVHPVSGEADVVMEEGRDDGDRRRQRRRRDPQAAGGQEEVSACVGGLDAGPLRGRSGPPASGARQVACSVERVGSLHPVVASEPTAPPLVDDRACASGGAALEVLSPSAQSSAASPSVISPTLMRFEVPAATVSACVGSRSPAGVISPALEWRPADEVLPREPSPDPVADDLGGDVRFKGLTYARRARAHEQSQVLSLEDDPVHQSSPSLAAAFIASVSKSVLSVLPTPVNKRGRRQEGIATEPPRRSRRIAKLPPEAHNMAAASVCRTLGFEDARPEVTMDKYQRFWANPLVRNHVQVVAAMMGKELPAESALPLPGAITVV